VKWRRMKMKRLILLATFCLVLIVLASISFADSLVCDPQAGVTDYRVLGLNPSVTIVTAQPDGSVKYNVGAMAPGSYNGTIEAGKRYVLDGVPQGPARWSSTVPLALTVPDTPAASSGHAITGN